MKSKNREIVVTVNFRGLWEIPFITKKTEQVRLPAGCTVDTLINSLAAKYGDEFEKIIPFCNPVIKGRMITPYERGSTSLKDGEWITFAFGPDGG